MSVSSIMSSVGGLLLNSLTNNSQGNYQKIGQEFQQLGQDLQAGNLSAAQSDLTTLEQYAPQLTSSSSSSSSSSTQGSNPIAKEFSQLSQDLQSGNLSAAQSDFATLQQDFQNGSGSGHWMHHHHGGGGMAALSQDFQQLGQDLQSGNLSAAQQAYTTMQQEFPQLGQTGGQSSSSAQSSTPSVSVTV